MTLHKWLMTEMAEIHAPLQYTFAAPPSRTDVCFSPMDLGWPVTCFGGYIKVELMVCQFQV